MFSQKKKKKCIYYIYLLKFKFSQLEDTCNDDICFFLKSYYNDTYHFFLKLKIHKENMIQMTIYLHVRIWTHVRILTCVMHQCIEHKLYIHIYKQMMNTMMTHACPFVKAHDNDRCQNSFHCHLNLLICYYYLFPNII